MARTGGDGGEGAGENGVAHFVHGGQDGRLKRVDTDMSRHFHVELEFLDEPVHLRAHIGCFGAREDQLHGQQDGRDAVVVDGL